MKLRIALILVSILYNLTINSQTDENRPLNWAKKITDTKFTNLYKVNDSIYRCEQPDSLTIKIIESLGIKSILNLRLNYTDKDVIDGLPLNLYNVEMIPYNFSDNEIVRAMRILEYAPKPIIVHCWYGSDRTGVVIAMYRIIYQNWTKEDAILEMEEGGYEFHNVFINIPHYIRTADIAKIKSALATQK